MSARIVIVGAGLSGLACARALTARGVEAVVLEADDAVGGRVRTQRQDGFLIDRGFQVLLTAYPEAQAVFDYDALRLGAFAPGAGFSSLPLPVRTGGTLPFGVFICFESVFPEITRELVLEGAQFIVNTTNDAWFGRTAAPYQHLSMAVVRAVETGRPLLRAANTGISAIVDPSGSIAQTTELFDTALLTATVTPRTGMTPYVRFGDLLVGMCGLVLTSWTLNALRLRRWKEGNQPSDAPPLT